MVTDRQILEAVLTEVRGFGTRMDKFESRMDGFESRMDRMEERQNDFPGAVMSQCISSDMTVTLYFLQSAPIFASSSFVQMIPHGL